ncbi:MAG: DUF3110 domain-containing protein [Candidatus Fonsibacter ubiquis]
MFLLTLKDRKDDGAFAIQDKRGEKVLVLFEEEDDATRYAMMLEEEDDDSEMEMDVIEVDGALAIRTCKLYNYKYTVVTPNDIVIPPKLNDNFSKDPLA